MRGQIGDIELSRAPMKANEFKRDANSQSLNRKMESGKSVNSRLVLDDTN